jgi:hypothetical protein
VETYTGATYYDKAYIDALPITAANTHYEIVETLANASNYVCAHGLNTALEHLVIEFTLEVKVAQSNLPVVVGDRLKVQHADYNGNSSQEGYGVTVLTSSVNSFRFATHNAAAIFTHFGGEPSG